MKSFRDVELLSEYLDGRLKPSDSKNLETRLSSDPQLRAALNDLRQSRSLLRQLPQRRAPRNFTLSPKMAGIKTPEPHAYPVLRFASILATLLFFASFAFNLVPMSARYAIAPCNAINPCGMGGGGGRAEAPQSAAQDTQIPAAPLLSSAPNLAVTPTPEITTLLNSEITPSDNTPPAPTPEEYAKSVSPEIGGGAITNPTGTPFFVPALWQGILAVAAILLAVSAWSIRKINDNKIRKQWK